MTEKFIVTAALTGAIHTPTMSEHLPIKPDEIIEEARRAGDAGAAVLIALFDDDERPRKCLREKLSPNDLLEIDLKRLLSDGYGVIKVVALNPGDGRPEPGVVGYQRSFGRCFWCGEQLKGESILQPIPDEILQGDLPIIQKACP